MYLVKYRIQIRELALDTAKSSGKGETQRNGYVGSHKWRKQ